MTHRLLSLVGALALFLAIATPSHAQSTGAVGPIQIHTAKQTADFTDGSGVTTLQNIPGLQFSLPANQAVTWHIDCDIAFSQATQVADSFGLQFSNSPTNSLFGGLMATAATAFAAIAPATITNTVATNVITGTPGGAGILYAHIGGYVENASNASDTVVNVSVAQSTAANVIVIKRDSACTYYAVP